MIDKKTIVPKYNWGIIAAVVTIVLPYTFCFANRLVENELAIANMAVYMIVVVVLKKYFQKNNISDFFSTDNWYSQHNRINQAVSIINWFLIIRIAIILRDSLFLFVRLHDYRFGSDIEVLILISLYILIFFVHIFVSVRMGVQLAKIQNGNEMLKFLGRVIIFLQPLIILLDISIHFLIVSQMIFDVACSIIAVASNIISALFILLFYKAKKQQTNLLA